MGRRPHLCPHPRSSPVEQGLLPAVEGILQVPHQEGLAGHAEEALLSEPVLPDEVHALFHKQGCQAWAILALVVDGVLQALPEDPWAQSSLVPPSAIWLSNGGGRRGQWTAGGSARAKGGSLPREQIRKREEMHEAAGMGLEGTAGSSLACGTFKGSSGSMRHVLY